MVDSYINGCGKTVVLNKARNPLSRFMRKSVSSLADYAADKTGAIAVETAILTPFVLFGLLTAGTLGLSVYTHQKVYTAAYSGASYLHDKVAAGDYSGLQGEEDEQGELQPGEWITTAKLVIKDASGLPLDLSKIDIDTFCGCPAATPGELQNPDDEDELTGRTRFYDREPISTEQGDSICPANCANGSQSRILAEIIIEFEASSLKGGTEAIRETLVTRLR